MEAAEADELAGGLGVVCAKRLEVILNVVKMRFMAALVLIVLLVGGTAWASVCDLMCQAGRMTAACGSASAMVMGCDHCALKGVVSACAPMDCSRMVVVTDPVGEDHVVAIAGSSSGRVERLVLPEVVLVQESLRGQRSPLRVSEFHPLLVSLRV